jgi:hypothetical protein
MLHRPHPVFLTESVDDCRQREQTLVDILRLSGSNSFAVGHLRALGPSKIDQVEGGHSDRNICTTKSERRATMEET